MNILHAIILGIIEGITEFLPISSTAHLIMTSTLLGLDQTEFVKTFEIVIQLGAILAVAFVYIKTLLQDRALIPKLIAGFIPTAIAGFLFYPFIKELFFENMIIIALMLILGGIFLLFFEKLVPQENARYAQISDLPLKKAFIIGCYQCIAMIPGVSRAASTIVGSQIVGLTRQKAIEFSFLLALPTITAAAGLDLVKSNLNFASGQISLLLIGTFVSFICALLSIKWFIRFISTHSFKMFGVYRIIIGIIFLAVALIK